MVIWEAAVDKDITFVICRSNLWTDQWTHYKNGTVPWWHVIITKAYQISFNCHIVKYEYEDIITATCSFISTCGKRLSYLCDKVVGDIYRIRKVQIIKHLPERWKTFQTLSCRHEYLNSMYGSFLDPVQQEYLFSRELFWDSAGQDYTILE